VKICTLLSATELVQITCPPNQKADKPSTVFPIAVTFRVSISLVTVTQAVT